MSEEVRRLVVVPPHVRPSLIDRVQRFRKRRVAPPTDGEVAEEIAVLERRQVARRAHVAQLQKLIDRKQLELDNLKRRARCGGDQ